MTILLPWFCERHQSPLIKSAYFLYFYLKWHKMERLVWGWTKHFQFSQNSGNVWFQANQNKFKFVLLDQTKKGYSYRPYSLRYFHTVLCISHEISIPMKERKSFAVPTSVWNCFLSPLHIYCFRNKKCCMTVCNWLYYLPGLEVLTETLHNF